MKDEQVVSLEYDDEKFLTPRSCNGDACSVVELNARNHPNTNLLALMRVRNRSSERTIRVHFDWGNALGGCGVSNTVTVFPREVEPISISADYMILGYCRMTANYV